MWLEGEATLHIYRLCVHVGLSMYKREQVLFSYLLECLSMLNLEECTSMLDLEDKFYYVCFAIVPLVQYYSCHCFLFTT